MAEPLARRCEDLDAIRTSVAIETALARTPARLLVGRTGTSYRTGTHLGLRSDHAAAADAVHAEIDLERDLGREFVAEWQIFEVQTRARTRAEFLMRPDLGRRLDDAAAAELRARCQPGADLQVAIGDGLSAAAVVAQAPQLLPLLAAGARSRGWQLGQPFFINHCRVGILNDLGDLLDPAVAVLLVGERPGLATAESLSAYMAYRPRSGHTDAQRNLVSNIHVRGLDPATAALRILGLAERMLAARASGTAIKDDAIESPARVTVARQADIDGRTDSVL